MKMVKGLLLGSAAGVVAIAGAQAADLPVKAKPVQYVKICSLYGAGFYYIPGTDMCLKVGGWARMQVGEGWNGSYSYNTMKGNGQNRFTSDMPWRYKGIVSVDSRNQTEYGTVRSYVAVGTSNSFVGSAADAATLYAPRWFMQWAGFTIGHASSFYDFYSNGPNQYGTVINGPDSTDGGWDVLAYTAQFGNGLSASISAELTRRTEIVNIDSGAAAALATGTASTRTFTGASTTANGYAGSDMPDVVANLRVDQAWGSAQIMGALHDVGAQYYNTFTTGGILQGNGHPNDKWGFAVGAGIKLNAPMIGPGDYLQAEVNYTQGALRYLNQYGNSFDWAVYHGTSLAYGLMNDAVFGGDIVSGNASSLNLTTGWSLQAAYTHFWNTQWRTTVWGAYEKVDFNAQANAQLCSGQGFGVGGAGTTAVAAPGCNNDWSVWGLGVRTQWNVTPDFYIGLEVLYADLKSATTPTGLITPSANPAGYPTGAALGGTFNVADQQTWAWMLRVHKDFYP